MPEANVGEHSSVPQNAERVSRDEMDLEPISFVIRIWRQEGTTRLNCRGWAEHVRSGDKSSFLGLHQLSSIIEGYIDRTGRRRRRWRDYLIDWYVRMAARFAPGGKET